MFDTNLGGTVSPNVTFYVYAGSDAERYAIKYDIRWTLNLEEKTLYLEGTGQTWIYNISDEQRPNWEAEFPSDWVFSELPAWIEYESEIENLVIGDGITHINAFTFCDLYNLKHVDFGTTVEFVDFAFWGSGLEEITFPENVKIIGAYTLCWDTILRKVTFECDDVEIRWGALAACENLTFYVYEGSKAHESAKWYEQEYGIHIAFRED